MRTEDHNDYEIKMIILRKRSKENDDFEDKK